MEKVLDWVLDQALGYISEYVLINLILFSCQKY